MEMATATKMAMAIVRLTAIANATTKEEPKVDLAAAQLEGLEVGAAAAQVQDLEVA
jgi:hypothetical protein